MPKLKFIKASAVRKHVNRQGKKVTPQVLCRVDDFVGRKLNEACNAHNGGRVTLDLTVLEFVGIVEAQ